MLSEEITAFGEMHYELTEVTLIVLAFSWSLNFSVFLTSILEILVSTHIIGF